jgi:hypothetical protein
MDWADEKAREWVGQWASPIDLSDDEQGDFRSSLATLLREVASEALVTCCVCDDVKAPRPDCECVTCHRNQTLAEVRRVVEEVREACARGLCDLGTDGWMKDYSGSICSSILSRLDKLNS